MSNQPSQPPDDSTDTPSREWEGYSDYKYVSYQISSSINDAVAAYSNLKSRHDEGTKIDREFAADARSRIMEAAMQLVHELDSNKGPDNNYAEIVEDWTESGVRGETGYIAALQDTRLKEECPDWLYEFVLQIRRAGWELGYLQAGRYQDNDDEEDEARASAREMLKDIYDSK